MGACKIQNVLHCWGRNANWRYGSGQHGSLQSLWSGRSVASRRLWQPASRVLPSAQWERLVCAVCVRGCDGCSSATAGRLDDRTGWRPVSCTMSVFSYNSQMHVPSTGQGSRGATRNDNSVSSNVPQACVDLTEGSNVVWNICLLK